MQVRKIRSQSNIMAAGDTHKVAPPDMASYEAAAVLSVTEVTGRLVTPANHRDSVAVFLNQLAAFVISDKASSRRRSTSAHSILSTLPTTLPSHSGRTAKSSMISSWTTPESNSSQAFLKKYLQQQTNVTVQVSYTTQLL